ncbi:MAG: hypothetical protein JWM36_683 [Hyphomicrobiales bacterium]|nr:hypothetical protein [Hyphomicrobiales bacterium]
MRFWLGGPRIFGIRPGISLGPEDVRAMRDTPSGKNRSVPRFIPIIMLWVAMVLVATFFHDAGASWVAAGLPTALVGVLGAWALMRF